MSVPAYKLDGARLALRMAEDALRRETSEHLRAADEFRRCRRDAWAGYWKAMQ